MLLMIVFATIGECLLSFIGVLVLAKYVHKIRNLLPALVAMSAGALIGGAFLHLIPEAVEKMSPSTMGDVILWAFIIFFLIEKIFHWHQCHKGKCHDHTLGYMNLIGDAIHNFIDGSVIAVAFMTDIKLGIVTAIAVGAHEIPHEIGDFSVLLYAGFSRKKALISNLLVSLAAVAGAIAGYALFSSINSLASYLLPFAAGGFIYIAASDLMPEIREVDNFKASMLTFVMFVFGIALMYLVKMIGLQ